jgi:hypothetical protein
MKKLLFNIFLFFLPLAFIPKIVLADVPNPNYFIAKCHPSEMMVECSYSSEEPFGPKTYNGCAEYENNPKYRFLEQDGSSFGGDIKFCFKDLSSDNFIIYHIKVLLQITPITLLLEIPIFLVFFGFRTKKALRILLTANLLSVPTFYLATILLPTRGYVPLLVMELIVIIFEAILIKFMFKENRLKNILIYSFIANIWSAIIGSIILDLIGDLMEIMPYFFPLESIPL